MLLGPIDARPILSHEDEPTAQALCEAGLATPETVTQRQIRRAQWIEHKKICFQGMGYRWHAPEVARYHESDARLRIVSAPARGAKSYSCAADRTAMILPTRPLTSTNTALIGIDYSTLKEFEYMREWLCEREDLVQSAGGKVVSNQFSPNQGNLTIEIRWPGRDASGKQARALIRGLSASNERGLQGEEWTYVVLSEAAEHDRRIWEKYMSTRFWRADFPTTPKPYAGWIRDLIRQGERDPELDIEHFTFPKEANPTYDHDRFAIAERQAKMRSPTGKPEDDPYFAEQFLGWWVWYTGSVLPFSRARHVIDPSLVEFGGARIFVSMDLGYDHPSVAHFWAVLPSGIYVIFDEIYERRLDSYALIDRIVERLDAHGIEADYFTGDPQRPETQAWLQRCGLPVITMNKKMQRDRAVGHRRLVDALTEGPLEGYPGMYLTSNCVHTIQEWEDLRYKEGTRDEDGKGAFVGRDDGYDCLIAGTKIETTRGSVPIESVRIGDRVRTRKGWRRVYDAWRVADRAKVYTVTLSDGRTLTGTRSHRFWVEGRGWVPLDALRYGDILSECRKRRSETDKTVTARRAGSGRAHTVRFLRSITSIIGTEIRETTLWRIWSAFRRRIISAVTRERLLGSMGRGCRSTWRTCRSWQKPGIALKRVVDGIVSMHFDWLENVGIAPLVASSAARIIDPRTQVDFARMPASQNGAAIIASMTRSSPASSAEPSSRRTDTTRDASAPVAVQRVHGEPVRRAVYDLSVEGTPEFYANGILVHNSARYGIMTLAQPREPEPEPDWLAHMRRERRREQQAAHPEAMNLYRWAATGRSPYA